MELPPPVAICQALRIHGAEYPCRAIDRQVESFHRSYSSGSTIEKPSHMIIVSGMPTRRKSENL